MRKTFEAIQAWRRMHGGRYPGRLADLKSAGLLPVEGAICPEALRERLGADAAHAQISSRRGMGDPPELYEYEMSDKVAKSGDDRMFLPPGATNYTRQTFKSELLRRQFFEQVPILRCVSHRGIAPAPYAGRSDPRRNLTVEGKVYWSAVFWEELWLDDVPYCAREANVMFGLKGPPFYVDRPPALPTALDLRKWNCAFGDHAWWWTYPIFEEGINRQDAPHLRALFEENHGRSVAIASNRWWLNGLVQLQGKILTGSANRYKGPGLHAFSWQKTGLQIDRPIAGADWLQGTVWTADPGTIAGWLVWHFQDEREEWVPLVYGKNTARFWAPPSQIEQEKSFPEPVWRHQEIDTLSGRERWLRLYRQEWRNPRPNVPVTTLDFVSNPECPAAPFLIAVNTDPQGGRP